MKEIWINELTVIKIITLFRVLLPSMLFAWNLPRRNNFAARVAVWTLGCVAATLAIPVLSRSLMYVSTIFLLEYIMAAAVVIFAFRTDLSTTLFVAAASFSAEHIASMLDSIVSVCFPQLFRYGRDGAFTFPILANYFFFMILVYTAVYLLFFRRMKNTGGNSVSLVTSLMLAVISLIVNLYWNLAFSAVTSGQSEVTLIFVYVMNVVISSLLLVCQFGIQRENDMKMRLAMSELLQSQAQEQYRVSKENYDAISIKCHDLKHRLLEMRTSGMECDFDDIIQSINSYGAEIKTGSDVLDVIFQEKNFQCQKRGIQFTCIIDGKALDFMDKTDLYVLFGNLIDNCIEAVTKLPEGQQKIIDVRVNRQKGFVIIATENGFMGSLTWKDGRLSTSKGDKENHGFGMMSIEKIASKYSGKCSISAEDGVFSLDIVFPMICAGGKKE